jgi:Amt family ammonium transporter
MTFFTALYGGKSSRSTLIVLCFLFSFATLLLAQTDTTTDVSSPGQISLDSNAAATNATATNGAPALSVVSPMPDISNAPAQPPPAPPATRMAPETPDYSYASHGSYTVASACIPGALMALASLGGFLLYYCGLTRAKNSGHTSTLLLIGVLFGLTGYWIGGFALQSGGIGDSHAALAQPPSPAERSALDHELGPVLFNHHWGIMGSAGFFLATDDSARDGISTLFLVQSALLAIALAASLGAALERGRLLAVAFCAYLIGVLVYPLFANWVWGGGWLAEMGREFGLGHGFVDLGGAGVVHETAGVVALIIAVVLGPRHGRFGRTKPSNAIPGHNVPLIAFGSIVLLVSWMAANALGSTSLVSDAAGSASSASLAAINTLLAAAGGLIATFIQTAWQKQRPEPARLCRGLLGGAVASCGGAGLIDPWAAFLIGVVAGLLVQEAMLYLERKRIDDPVGAAAVHGAGGAWGVLALGFFANGTAGTGLNGVASPVRGLFFGGAWHQLAAQVIGCVAAFAVVYLLGLACVNLVQKILGLRVDLADETSGLDWSEVGALGYQGDVEPEETNGK